MRQNEKSSIAYYLNAAGTLLFIGALQWFIVEMAAETLFPGYSTRANDLSDLASTVPPNTSIIAVYRLEKKPFGYKKNMGQINIG